MSDRDKVRNLLPRFLTAVGTMASSTEQSRRARLAEAVETITCFTVEQFPNDLKPTYMELWDLLHSAPPVPAAARNHPNHIRTVPAFYLSHQRAERAVHLIIELLEGIAFRLAATD
jgi:hypothetical protein